MSGKLGGCCMLAKRERARHVVVVGWGSVMWSMEEALDIVLYQPLLKGYKLQTMVV